MKYDVFTLVSLDCFLRTKAFKEKEFGTFNLDTALSYNNLGCVYHHLRIFDRALDFFTKALYIRERVLGIEHPEIAHSYYNIGKVYVELGNYNQSLVFLKKALELFEKIMGPDYPDAMAVKKHIEFVKSRM